MVTESYSDLDDSAQVFEIRSSLRDQKQVRGRLLGTKPLPGIREVFAEVRKEESRKRVMLGTTKPSSINNQLSALAARQQESSDAQGPVRVGGSKNRTWCDHCQRPYHTKDTCWKLHGKPADWKPRNQRDNRALQANSNDTKPEISKPSSSFTVKQLEEIQALLTKSKTVSTPSSNLAQKGNYLSSIHNISNNNGPWVVDFGASDHMTGCHSMFSHYVPCAGNLKIQIADGSLSTVAGKCLIQINGLTLESVLHVPNLKCNLISVSKLAKDSNCVVKLFSSHCEFQDLITGKTIGNAREHEGLYYLENSHSLMNKQALASGRDFNSVSDTIMLWHFRLGHPNFFT